MRKQPGCLRSRQNCPGPLFVFWWTFFSLFLTLLDAQPCWKEESSIGIELLLVIDINQHVRMSLYLVPDGSHNPFLPVGIFRLIFGVVWTLSITSPNHRLPSYGFTSPPLSWLSFPHSSCPSTPILASISFTLPHEVPCSQFFSSPFRPLPLLWTL